MKDLRHAQRHRGLAGARVAGEAHVQTGALRLQAVGEAQPVDDQQRGNVADALLHRREPDQVAVDVVEHRLDLRIRQHLGDGARRRRLGRCGCGSRAALARDGVQRSIHRRLQ